MKFIHNNKLRPFPSIPSSSPPARPPARPPAHLRDAANGTAASHFVYAPLSVHAMSKILCLVERESNVLPGKPRRQITFVRASSPAGKKNLTIANQANAMYYIEYTHTCTHMYTYLYIYIYIYIYICTRTRLRRYLSANKIFTGSVSRLSPKDV
jgi:hypothetical protein